MSLQTFIGSGKLIKLVPVYFVFMSSRKQSDYLAIFKLLKETHQLEIDKLTGNKKINKLLSKYVLIFMLCFTVDFELAVWNAATKVFKEIQIHGCLFRFEQAIHRKINVSIIFFLNFG